MKHKNTPAEVAAWLEAPSNPAHARRHNRDALRKWNHWEVAARDEAMTLNWPELRERCKPASMARAFSDPDDDIWI